MEDDCQTCPGVCVTLLLEDGSVGQSIIYIGPELLVRVSSSARKAFPGTRRPRWWLALPGEARGPLVWYLDLDVPRRNQGARLGEWKIGGSCLAICGQHTAAPSRASYEQSKLSRGADCWKHSGGIGRYSVVGTVASL